MRTQVARSVFEKRQLRILVRLRQVPQSTSVCFLLSALPVLK